MEDSYQSPPIVMDTNVLVAGACRHESSMAYRLLLGVFEETYPTIVTEAIVLEYLDVLARPAVRALTGLNNPAIGWVQISKGMGVPAVTVNSCDTLVKELKKALNEPGPHLIEMVF